MRCVVARYPPATNYYGSDRFTFKVNDSTLRLAEAEVSITIPSVNDVPTVTLSHPFRDAQFIGPATIELEADASDVDGELVVRVEFFDSAAPLGESTASPFRLLLTKVVAVSGRPVSGAATPLVTGRSAVARRQHRCPETTPWCRPRPCRQQDPSS